MFYISKEEQRYGRNKDTTINHTYINSGEYRRKFDNVSTDRGLNRLIYNLTKNKNLVTIHSHPSSFPPSIEDFNSAYVNKYKFGIVCGHNGNLFVYSLEERVPPETYYYLAGKYYKKYRDEYIAQMHALTELSKSYKIYFREVLIK